MIIYNDTYFIRTAFFSPLLNLCVALEKILKQKDEKNKSIVLYFLGVMSLSISGQMGIGKSSPRGALDINNTVTYNMGLVLPANTTPTNLINPQGGSIAEGTMMYDTTRKCPRFYNGTAWSECLCDQCNGTTIPTMLADCTKNGLEGTYLNGVAMSGAKFTVTLTNNSFATQRLHFKPAIWC